MAAMQRGSGPTHRHELFILEALLQFDSLAYHLRKVPFVHVPTVGVELNPVQTEFLALRELLRAMSEVLQERFDFHLLEVAQERDLGGERS